MGKTRDLLKNLEIPSKHFCKDGLNKGQTFHGPNRSRRYQKRQPKYTEELYIKDIHDPDNHDDVIIHLEPDILECKLKWVLGIMTTKKASEGDRIPVELIQIPKDNAMKGLHSTWHQMWKIQHWPQDWKRAVFTPIPKKGNAKEFSNYYIVVFISYATKLLVKIIQAMLQQYINQELPDIRVDFPKGRATKIKLPTSAGSVKNQESSKRRSTSVLLRL